jgi:hypothetical protein
MIKQNQTRTPASARARKRQEVKAHIRERQKVEKPLFAGLSWGLKPGEAWLQTR